jgi:hypothetical protein
MRASFPFRCRPAVLLAPFALLAGTAARAADPAVEQMVGGIEAVVFVCGPIDPKSAKTGQDLLQKTSAERKLDLAAIRGSDAYKAIYNSEVNRLLALPARERAAACRSAW